MISGLRSFFHQFLKDSEESKPPQRHFSDTAQMMSLKEFHGKSLEKRTTPTAQQADHDIVYRPRSSIKHGTVGLHRHELFTSLRMI